MRINRLTTEKVTSSKANAPVASIDERELKNVAGGVAPFSCAMLVETGSGPDIAYHDGYPR